ncbi:hypothetical protein D1872_235490 [compost metagenome]
MQPVAPMVNVQAQLRSEAVQFPLPVSQQRSGAHDQAGSGRIGQAVQQLRNDLDRFAEPHIVGQQSAESQLTHGRQPLEASFLVRPERTVQRFGHRARLRVPQQLAVHQNGQQPLRLHTLYLEPFKPVVIVRPGSQVHQVAEGQHTAFLPLHKLQHLAEFLDVDFDPFPAEQDERRFGGRQPGKFLLAQFLSVQYGARLESDQLLDAESSLRSFAFGLAPPARGLDLHPGGAAPFPGPAGRHLHRHPLFAEKRHGPAQKSHHLRRFQ